MVGKAVAVIPARGGSKRIPEKNIIDFFGKPLLAWTLEAAKESGIFHRIVVSTDSERIADTARALGYEVPFLRASHADDMSPVSQASIAAVQQCRDFYCEKYDHVVQLMPNCPLRRASHIVDAFRYYESHGNPHQISCFRFGWMNPWWAATLDADLHPSPLFPRAGQNRSQDLAPLYCPSGAIWISSCDALFRTGTFYGDGHVFFPMSWDAAVDIDDEADLRMALALLKLEKDRLA